MKRMEIDRANVEAVAEAETETKEAANVEDVGAQQGESEAVEQEEAAPSAVSSQVLLTSPHLTEAGEALAEPANEQELPVAESI